MTSRTESKRATPLATKSPMTTMSAGATTGACKIRIAMSVAMGDAVCQAHLNVRTTPNVRAVKAVQPVAASMKTLTVLTLERNPARTVEALARTAAVLVELMEAATAGAVTGAAEEEGTIATARIPAEGRMLTAVLAPWTATASATNVSAMSV